MFPPRFVVAVHSAAIDNITVEKSPGLSRSFLQRIVVDALFFSFCSSSAGSTQVHLPPCRHPLLLLHLLFIPPVPPRAPRGLIRTRERMRCARPNNPFGKNEGRGSTAYATVCGRIFGIPGRARNTS